MRAGCQTAAAMRCSGCRQPAYIQGCVGAVAAVFMLAPATKRAAAPQQPGALLRHARRAARAAVAAAAAAAAAALLLMRVVSATGTSSRIASSPRATARPPPAWLLLHSTHRAHTGARAGSCGVQAAAAARISRCNTSLQRCAALPAPPAARIPLPASAQIFVVLILVSQPLI
jgi:hypothetical protein